MRMLGEGAFGKAIANQSCMPALKSVLKLLPLLFDSDLSDMASATGCPCAPQGDRRTLRADPSLRSDSQLRHLPSCMVTSS